MAELYKQRWGAGAFMQTAGGPVSSLTGLAVSSSFVGNTNIRGIGIMNSGTAVLSVSAPGVASGSVILTNRYMGTTAMSSGQAIVTAAQSVRAGAFEIVCCASIAPNAAMPISWFVIQ